MDCIYMLWILNYKKYYYKHKKENYPMNELNDLMQKVNKFRDDRNWRQFHNEKDLAISINLEASELLELFQWQTSEETVEEKLPELKEELADVLIYAFMLADNLDLDIKEIME